jgi:hypothetical protein
MPRLFAFLPFLCALSAALLAQQNQTVTLQDKMTVSDSVQATVTYVSGDIRAGENFEFTVKLDRAPNFHGGALSVGFSLRDGQGSVSASVSTEPGQDVYHLQVQIPEAAHGGIWALTSLQFWNSAAWVNLPHKDVSFRVIPNPGIVYPTSAEITVNLSQVQLLRREATHIQGRIQQLKSAVSEYVRANREGAVSPLLERNLRESVSALRATQAEFSKLTTSEAQGSKAEIFFDDLRKSYEDAISHLVRATATFKGEERLVRVSEVKKAGAEPFLSLTLRPMEQNELAYNVVADQGSLTFDLEVDSTPEGAAVTYSRRGDPPRGNPDPTRSTIRSLAYAIWTVHFEKPGYKPEEREHDPFREPNHAVHVDLQK